MTAKSIVPFLLVIPALLHAGSSSITLTSSTNPAVFGHPVTLTAAVTPSSATGVVTFYSGTTVLETEPLIAGQATMTTILLPFGSQSLKAYYLGDSNDAPSISAILSQTVNAVPGTALGTPSLYTTGEQPEGGAVADFNNDGKADIAIANYESGGVSVLLGNGDGTFQPEVSYAAGTNPNSIAVGDFNGDGNPDIVVGNGNSVVSVLLGNGDGTFQAAVNYLLSYTCTTGPFCTGVAVEDFNNDGNADIVETNTESGSLTVLLGKGDGSFLPPVLTHFCGTSACNGAGPAFLTVGDFNGDGKPDVAVANLGSTYASILLGNGDGTFQPPVNYQVGNYTCTGISVGDFNGDGKTDLAVTTGDALLLVLLGNGDGTFQPPFGYYLEGSVRSVVVADFNGDGKADLGVTGSYFNLLYGNGDGTFGTPVMYPNNIVGGAYGIGAADFNGDGRTDVALAACCEDPGAAVMLGTFPAPTTTWLASSLNPSHYGQNVILTATVSPATATGGVTFNQGSTSIGTGELENGTATLEISTLAAGAHALTATYSGSPNDASSTSPVLNQGVQKSSTAASLASSPNPSTFRQAVTLTATVSPGSATGTVTFYGGSTALGTSTLNGGTATFTLSTLSPGQHSLTARYSGDAHFTASTSSALTQVVRITTSTVLASSPNPSNLGQTVTLTATVSPSSAAGSVTFYHGSASLGASTLSGGKAILTISTLPKGSHALTATYGGNAADAPSTSETVVQVVN